MFRLLCFLCLLCASAAPTLWAATAGLEARLERNRIAEGETVTLSLTAPGDVWGTPDPSPLTPDFDLLDQSQASRMSIINGQSSSTREWRYLLAPKRAGTLTVPAIRVGDLTSAPLRLEVLPASQAAAVGEALPVLMEAETDLDAPYVQGQVLYRVRVLYRVPLRQATLSDPRAPGAIVERLGDDLRSETHRDGQRYQVIERRYAIFPQHSGPLSIEAPTLSAAVPEQEQGRGLRDRMPGFADEFERLLGRDPFADMGGLFERTRPVRLRGPAVDLAVRPRPEDATTPWLPAESLSLSETWSPDSGELRVGEPVTRTIAITAQAVTAAQLPDLSPDGPEGVRSYPDKPRAESRAEGDDLVSMKVIKQALVPTREGRLTLPEVRLAWWDLQADRERVAVLPERVVEVLPAAPGAAAPAQAQGPQVAPLQAERASPSQAAAAATPAEIPAPAGPAVSSQAAGGSAGGTDGIAAEWWAWIAAGLAAAWLTTLGLWLRERRRPRTIVGRSAPPAASAPLRPRDALAAVRLASAASDARAVRRALLDWGAIRWPQRPPQGLPELAARLDQGPARDVVEALERHLYGTGTGRWDGPAAWTRLEPALALSSSPAGSRGGAPEILPELYPQGG